MEAVCSALAGAPNYDASCLCRPLTPLPGVALEHATIGVVQLLKAAYLFLWLFRQRQRVVAAVSVRASGAETTPRASLLPGDPAGQQSASKTVPSARLVLPVYAKFLQLEAWQCLAWGLLFSRQAYADAYDAYDVMVSLQLMRYLCSFCWALCGEGIFLFLTLASAGAESLHIAIRAAALWACALLLGSALLWTRWASCSQPPEHWLLQAALPPALVPLRETSRGSRKREEGC